MSDIIFVADYFAHQVPGGGELNNAELIKLLREKGHTVTEINSYTVDRKFVEDNAKSNFIIANFVSLAGEAKTALASKKYIIYEHDHKYLACRNPAMYKNFIAPIQDIINLDFYSRALAVICQSTFHEEIVKNNLKINNILNVGGNLWGLQALDFFVAQCAITKNSQCSIMDSHIPHKNTSGALKLCHAKDLDYELIPNLPYYEFLRRLGTNETFIFLPQTPETLGRVVVEARMMGMKVITNSFVGATKEDWFKLVGPPLIKQMKQKREDIPELFINLFKS